MPPHCSLNSQLSTLNSAGRRSRAFSLIEMLATVAALVILLGLMVSLARYVRDQASEQLTKQLLAQLDEVMAQYKKRYDMLPAVPAFVAPVTIPGAGAPAAVGRKEGQATRPAVPVPLLPPGVDEMLPDEQTLQHNARLNNR